MTDASGKAARATAPRSSHGEWRPAADRFDPVRVLIAQDELRTPELVPIGHQRMLTSPFAFFRGSAAIMAADLAGTPVTGMRVQLCGDAHLSNFGGFAAPDRSLGFEMRAFAEMRTIDVWYLRIDVDRQFAELAQRVRGRRRRKIEKDLTKARAKNSLRALQKLTHTVDGEPRIISDPPLVVPLDELVEQAEAEHVREHLTMYWRSYEQSVQSDRRHLLGSYRPVDIGPQGRGSRQRGHARVDRADAGSRRDRSAVPAAQGVPALGAGAVRRRQQDDESGAARRRRPADDPGGQRRPPWLVSHRPDTDGRRRDYAG